MHETELSIPASRVHDWLTLVNRTVRGIRFYPPHSDIRTQLVDTLLSGTSDLLGAHGEVVLRIRDGAIDHGSEVVMEDADPKSFGNILFENNVLELVMLDGITRIELESLLTTISADYGRSCDGEELATALWRLELPHVRYEHVDLLSIALVGNPSERHQRLVRDDEEFNRLKKALDEITSSLAVDRKSGADLVAQVDGMLETPNDHQAATDIARRWFDGIATAARARMNIRDQQSMALELRTKNSHDEIVVHLVTLLFDALRREPRPHDPSAALELLLFVFDGIIEAHQFDDAARVVRRMSNYARRAREAGQVEFAHRFLVRFGHEGHVRRAVHAFLRGESRDRAKVLAYLDALGRYAVAPLLAELEEVENAQRRIELCELVMRHAKSRIDLIVGRLPRMRHEVATTLVLHAKLLPAKQGSQVVWTALAHRHEQVRAAAVRALAKFDGAHAERAVVEALSDESDVVVGAAARVVQSRNIFDARGSLERLLSRERLLDADPRLASVLLDAYARLEHERSVPVLERLARSPGLIAPKRSMSVALAAVKALGHVVDPIAIDALSRIARTMNTTVRRAARETCAEVRAKVEAPAAAHAASATPRPVLEAPRDDRRRIVALPLETPPPLPAEFLTPTPMVASKERPAPPVRLPSNALRPLLDEPTPPSRAVLRFEVDANHGDED